MHIVDASLSIPPLLPLSFRSRFWCLPAHDSGSTSTECECREAKHWISEMVAGTNQQFELCCKRGDAILNQLRAPPPFLQALLKEDNPQARSFHQNIRAYNSALAFTSVSYTKDTRTDLSCGLHCFQIHDKLFHYQGPLQPGSQEAPAFA
jgi:hypothetical protein